MYVAAELGTLDFPFFLEDPWILVPTLLPKGRHRNQLIKSIENILREDISGCILPFDRIAARVCAFILVERHRAQGEKLITQVLNCEYRTGA